MSAATAASMRARHVWCSSCSNVWADDSRSSSSFCRSFSLANARVRRIWRDTLFAMASRSWPQTQKRNGAGREHSMLDGQKQKASGTGKRHGASGTGRKWTLKRTSATVKAAARSFSMSTNNFWYMELSSCTDNCSSSTALQAAATSSSFLTSFGPSTLMRLRSCTFQS